MENDLVKVYQKGDKTLLFSKEEITFQTKDKILKRKMNEFERFKDISFNTDKSIDRPELTGKVEKKLINDPVVKELYKIEQRIIGSMRVGCSDPIGYEARDKLTEIMDYTRDRTRKRVDKLLKSKNSNENVIFKSK